MDEVEVVDEIELIEDDDGTPPPIEIKSYTDWLYLRTCQRKIAYASIGPASRAILRYKDRYGVPMVPYQCRFCALWHLTKRQPKEQR